MPSSSSSSQQHDGQQQQQQKQQSQKQRHSDLSKQSNTNSDIDEEFCPDPRLATAAAAAAALSRSSSATPSSSSPSATTTTTTTTSSSSSSNAVSSYQRLVKRYRVEVAASASSVLSTLTTFPLDSVKTRMQTYRYAGFLDCVRHTYHTEKFRGFFRGVTAPMASITLVRTVSFSIYQRSKYVYCDWVKRNFAVDVMAHVSSSGSYPNLWSVATFGAAGATAGSCITVIACPFELTKLSAQVSVLMADKKNCPKPGSHAIAASYQNKGTLKTLGNIIKHRGFGGLYTGFRLHLMRDTLGTATYFMTYESSKQLLTTFGGDGTHSNPLAVLVAGGLCGIVSWALIYPVDSAKSIYQRNSLMYSRGEKVEPVKIRFFQRNMYRGLGVSMGRSCAVNAVFFSSFEFLKKRIKAWED
ncbi:mitochondrial carrier domain-containing protein [Parachaetomium inaequale]|uniref:Mitochondrial carrier domain-containing protein n=1 Tax=Parachaetomium inaequale TaxID=2588326 RepID=A0AAN6SPX6_9PEZI|nr:mitochondrial carrier domain-containing protein [Parachaetomium inaequale]